MLRSLGASRRFLPDPVPDEIARELIETARWTGSARNRQPWRVALIADPQRRATLAGLGTYAGFLADAPLVVLLAIDHHHGGVDAEFDAGRFAQTLMLAAHAQALGSCPVSFFPSENVRVATAMTGLGDPWEARTAIAIGYPDRSPSLHQRRSAIPTGRHSTSVILATGG